MCAPCHVGEAGPKTGASAWVLPKPFRDRELAHGRLPLRWDRGSAVVGVPSGAAPRPGETPATIPVRARKSNLPSGCAWRRFVQTWPRSSTVDHGTRCGLRVLRCWWRALASVAHRRPRAPPFSHPHALPRFRHGYLHTWRQSGPPSSGCVPGTHIPPPYWPYLSQSLIPACKEEGISLMFPRCHRMSWETCPGRAPHHPCSRLGDPLRGATLVECFLFLYKNALPSPVCVPKKRIPSLHQQPLHPSVDFTGWVSLLFPLTFISIIGQSYFCRRQIQSCALFKPQ